MGRKFLEDDDPEVLVSKTFCNTDSDHHSGDQPIEIQIGRSCRADHAANESTKWNVYGNKKRAKNLAQRRPDVAFYWAFHHRREGKTKFAISGVVW